MPSHHQAPQGQEATRAPRELIACWAINGFCVLVPKMRGRGFLRVPFGHHEDPALSKIADLAQCDIFGLDGHLEFQTPPKLFHGGDAARQAFADKALQALSNHYGVPARLVGSAEFWRLHPLGEPAPVCATECTAP